MARKRQSYHHGDLREALVRESVALLEEREGPNFSLRELAERIGVSHTASYRHFKDKASLFVAVAIDGFRRLEKTEKSVLEAEPDPLRRIRAFGVGYVEFARRYPWHFRVMFSMSLGDSDRYPELLEVGQRGFRPIVEAVAEAQARGQVRPGDPKALAVLLWASVHGLAMLIIDRQLDFDPDIDKMATRTLIEEQADAMIRGLEP